ncbi:MAG: ABC transporter permease subunit, partial [Alphaproteobacteria bacterium]|nr:ABC transporter permease subunit [Alphaproteobacteria bacterium]
MTDISSSQSANLNLVKPKMSRDDWIMRGAMILIGLFLFVAILLPLFTMLSKSIEDKDGAFVGLTNYLEFFSTPALFYSIFNSLQVAIVASIVVLVTAFMYAYALTRTCMPFKWFFKIVALIPLLTPSLLSGISLVYWFGNQGVAKDLLMGESIYGPIGVVIGSSYWVFPHALMIIITALSIADSRLYEAADALRTSKIRTFFTVTLPGAKYG